MTNLTDSEILAAHRHFAADCFNRVWDLSDLPERTPAQDAEMLALALASHWHWSQHPECTAQNHSIGYWQIARVFALLKQPENARRYAMLCLEVSRQEGVAPFFLGYAYEALARAEALAGDRAAAERALVEARRIAQRVTATEDREQLLEDLENIL